MGEITETESYQQFMKLQKSMFFVLGTGCACATDKDMPFQNF